MDLARLIHGLVRDDPHVVVKAEQEFASRRVEQGLSFEGREYPVALEPFVLDPAQADAAQLAGERMHLVLERIGDVYRLDERVRRFFGVYRDADRWLCAEPLGKPYAGASRFDGVLIDGTYRIMEANTCCPGGVIKVPRVFGIWQSIISDVIGVPAPDAGPQPFILRPDLFARTLLALYNRQFGRAPRGAAIVNLNGRYTNEVDLMVADLAALGVSARVCDVTELARTNAGGLRLADLDVDLAYNKLDHLELIAMPQCADYLDAATAGGFCFLNTLMAQCVLEDSAAVALMSDPRFDDVFDGVQRAAIERHVPWTRVMERGRTTTVDGDETELEDFVLRNQNRLVLKQRGLTRGEGVFIGVHTPPPVWQNAVAEAMHTRGSIVQECLELPMTDIAGGEPLHLRRMWRELAVYVLDGRFAGFLARASLDPVVNVGREGLVVPVVVAGSDDVPSGGAAA